MKLSILLVSAASAGKQIPDACRGTGIFDISQCLTESAIATSVAEYQNQLDAAADNVNTLRNLAGPAPRPLTLCNQGLVSAARSARAWVITGGTDTGVMHLVGKAMHTAGVVGKVPNPNPNPNPNPDPNPNPNPNPNQVPLIGISAYGAVNNRDKFDSLNYNPSHNLTLAITLPLAVAVALTPTPLPLTPTPAPNPRFDSLKFGRAVYQDPDKP